jgi:glycosyltransferase involved in cell wall biosynthesis
LNSTLPKVSVICVCYNHDRFVDDCIESLMKQTYKNFEIIIVDDGSTDKSVILIEQIVKRFPEINFIKLETNQGVCAAFNVGLKHSTGEFIIDLSTDDILYCERIEKGVNLFQEFTPDYGVIFSDVEWIDEDSNHLNYQSERFPHRTIPQGDIYKNLIEFYFVCSPSMMYRREVIEKLKGYDETLTYEDFDFWIRSSRDFKYAYDREVLVKKRKVRNSLSEQQFKRFNTHGLSTYRVCEKIMTLNKTKEERRALRRRLIYEFRQSIRTMDFPLAYKYFLLFKKNLSIGANGQGIQR